MSPPRRRRGARSNRDWRVYFEAAFNDNVDHMQPTIQYLPVPGRWIASVHGVSSTEQIDHLGMSYL